MATRRSNRAEVKASWPVRDGVAVIGLGNWGTSLLASLRAARVPVLERVHAAPQTKGRAQVRGAVSLADARLDARVLWLAVPDGAIAAVTERMKERRSGKMRGQIVVHSSGAHSSAILQAAMQAGAFAASVHPLMSFPTREAVPLADLPFAVEAADPGTRRKLFALVRKLGGQPFALSAEGKALYHAAGMFASPLLTGLLAVAIKVMEDTGLCREEAMRLLGPIARQTVENVFRSGPERRFSGPLARGDSGTVDLHLRALAADPLCAGVYRSLALAALVLLPSADAEALRDLLERAPAAKGGGPPPS